MNNIQISPISIEDIGELLKFTDKWIGKNYFSETELQEIIKKSSKGNLCCSFKAVVDGKLAGIRLSFSPGSWIGSDCEGLSESKWKVNKEKMAYFKSLFISDDYQKMGLGKKLSNVSMDVLKEMGARAILCHSWLESPENSSQRYLQSFGFESVATFEGFWSGIDYQCTRCAPQRCGCTAVEMIKYL